MKHSILFCIAAVLMLGACTSQSSEKTGVINQQTVQQTIAELKELHPNHDAARLENGVAQAASLWIKSDGSAEDFKQFCIDNYVNDETEREKLFFSLSEKFEILFGHFNNISIALKRPLHLDLGEVNNIDMLMGGYNAMAHLTNDLFENKFAFITILNFPSYTLAEKEAQGDAWTSRQWAYARMGDMFTSRTPASVLQAISEANSAAGQYIAEYNIIMGNLLNEQGETIFPERMRLISHWGLRDELKSNYADAQNGLEKQEMIYQVMMRIILQEIPQMVINNADFQWNPFSNNVYENGAEIKASPEPNTRYQHILNNFKALSAQDPYTSLYPTFIQRSFDENRELSLDEVRAMFVELVSSPQVKEVAELIKHRLGRELQPFDIWYDGFKARSSINEEDLSAITRRMYPNRDAFQDALPAIMIKFGWTPAEAERISSKIHVDASRGAGHAWRALMRGEKALLRTRINADGMDYKGFNIAIHELGHNVEQTISLYDVDYYILNGIPNVAFTEAIAFAFQRRDLELLGIVDNNPNNKYLQALDIFWGSYEIMGVSLVDMAVWEWLYANPNATAQQLKENVIRIAKEVWNVYYAPVFGVSDSPILAIYSHAITNPLYLSNYPLGRVIDFQIAEYLVGKSFPDEFTRMFSMGRLTPQVWMRRAVGSDISAQPLIRAADEAVGKMR
jgi:hypothetical protein